MSVNSRYIIPKDADPFIQIFNGKLDGNIDKTTLLADFHFLLEREKNHKIKAQDSEAYQYVCSRFREKLGLEVPLKPPPLPLQPQSNPPVKVKKVEAPQSKNPSLPFVDPSAFKIEFCYSAITVEKTVNDCISGNAMNQYLHRESGKEMYLFEQGERFTYHWLIKNCGELPLPASCQLKPSCSNNLDADPTSTSCFSKEISALDGEISISRKMCTPNAPGRYFDYFRILLPTGQQIGPLLICQIEVKRK